MKTPAIYDADSDEPRELPFKWEICGTCEGHGKSSSYLGAFTRDQLSDMGDDWCDDYFAGRMDRACDACDGLGKVKVADYSRMSAEDRQAYDEQREDDRATREIERQERLFEGGWREEGWFE